MEEYNPEELARTKHNIIKEHERFLLTLKLLGGGNNANGERHL